MRKGQILRTIISLLFVGLVLMTANDANAQKRKIRKGNKAFDLFEFSRALKFYDKALNKRPENFDAINQKAKVYHSIGNYAEAAKWYGELVKMEDQVQPLHVFYYAQMLRATKNYDSAKVYYLKYAALDSTDPRGQRLADGIDIIPDFLADSLEFRVVEFEQNGPKADFSPAFYDSSLVFVTSRAPQAKTDVWSDAPFLDLYISAKSDTGYGTPEPIPGDVNKIYHEGPVTFGDTLNTMYFTRNSYLKRRRKDKSSEGIMKLKVYESNWVEATEKQEAGWEEIRELPFNSDEYSIGHPSLSKDGKHMFFSSDMHDTIRVKNHDHYRNHDLYYVEVTDSGFGEPVNLGEGINTKGNEFFPFSYSDDTLYFSSDSYEGLGGLDIYYATKDDTGKWGNVTNVGYPINSNMDDFGVIVDEDEPFGYFSSNREGGKGDDDIYYFDDKVKVVLIGVVIDKKTGDSIPDAKVNLLDYLTMESDSVQSDSLGMFTFNLKIKNKYKATSEKYGYFLISPVEVNTNEVTDDTIRIVLEMQRIGLGEVIKLENIYYDFDKYNIREDAAVELDRFVEFMNDYDDLVVELRSHTDSRGSDSYNEWLSTRRAESAVNYVIQGGIPKERITAKGYGEKLPVNECVNDVPCTEEAHQLNRRTEFVVVKQPEGMKVKSSVTD